MKFLVDRCAGHRLAQWLQSQGHDVVESKDFGPDPGDVVLLSWANEDQRVLISVDTDFGHLIYMKKEPHCGLIRLPDVPAIQRINIMKHLLETHKKSLETGAIITIRGNKIRTSQ